MISLARILFLFLFLFLLPTSIVPVGKTPTIRPAPRAAFHRGLSHVTAQAVNPGGLLPDHGPGEGNFGHDARNSITTIFQKPKGKACK